MTDYDKAIIELSRRITELEKKVERHRMTYEGLYESMQRELKER